MYEKAKRDEKYQFIEEWKQARGCKDCGTFKHLTVDHVIPDNKLRTGNGKRFVGGLNRLSMKKLIIELEKCECVCSICHRIRTDKYIKSKSDGKYVRRLKTLCGIIKNTFGCAQCLYRNELYPSTLHFHHKWGKKVMEVSQIRDFNLFLQELSKCEILCANCHFEEHEKEKKTYRALRS